jgi:phage tail tape-measure protein
MLDAAQLTMKQLQLRAAAMAVVRGPPVPPPGLICQPASGAATAGVQRAAAHQSSAGSTSGAALCRVALESYGAGITAGSTTGSTVVAVRIVLHWLLSRSAASTCWMDYDVTSAIQVVI